MKTSFVLFFLAVMACAFGLLCGCDGTDPVDAPISVTPDSVTMNPGDVVTFTASDGYEYQWSLETSGWGTLSQRSGPTTTYTSTFNPGPSGTVVQVLSVVSTITRSAATNGEPNPDTVTGNSAQAFITHQGY